MQILWHITPYTLIASVTMNLHGSALCANLVQPATSPIPYSPAPFDKLRERPHPLPTPHSPLPTPHSPLPTQASSSVKLPVFHGKTPFWVTDAAIF
jgi:hypothetical protein